jgi:hypothetical protein
MINLSMKTLKKLNKKLKTMYNYQNTTATWSVTYDEPFSSRLRTILVLRIRDILVVQIRDPRIRTPD